jgi:hypothetical protein
MAPRERQDASGETKSGSNGVAKWISTYRAVEAEMGGIAKIHRRNTAGTHDIQRIDAANNSAARANDEVGSELSGQFFAGGQNCGG